MKLRFILAISLFLLLGSQAFAQEAAPELTPYEPHPRKDYVVTMHTPYGDMVLILYDQTPLHKANFLRLAEAGYFDSTGFHRIIRDFMIQGGDPNSKPGGNAAMVGQGGPGYTVPAEFVPELTHTKGALAAARQGDQVNPQKASSGSQFYIVQNPRNCRHLNGSYTVFGQVIQGLDVIDKIAAVEANRMGLPIDPVRIWVEVKRMRKKKILKTYDYPAQESGR